MKKLIAFLTLIALVLTFAACSKGGEGDSSEKDGTTEGSSVNGGEGKSEGIPAPSYEDYTTLAIEGTLTLGVTAEYNNYYSFYRTDSVSGYYYNNYTQSNEMLAQGTSAETFFHEVGDTVSVFHRVGGSEFNPMNGIMEGKTDKEAREYIFSSFGFGANETYNELEYTKGEDAKVGDFNCECYEITYTESTGEKVSGQICVDKETKIWVKSAFTTEGSDMTVTHTVNKIGTDISKMPGTIPVSVTAGQLYSESGLTLNLKGIEFDPTYAAVLKMEAVNATDSALKVKSKYFDVNGLCIGGTVFSVSVPAGESLDFDIAIPDSSCSAAGIDMIEEMVFAVSCDKYHVESSGEGDYDVSDGMLIEGSEEIKITARCPFTPEKEESGDRRVLCSTADFDVYFGGIRENSSGGYDFVVYYESEFDEDIRVTVNIHEVNGKAYDDSEKVYVYAGRKGFGGFSFRKDKVTERPTTLKLSFEAYYGEMYNGTCILEETEPFVLRVSI